MTSGVLGASDVRCRAEAAPALAEEETYPSALGSVDRLDVPPMVLKVVIFRG